VVWNSSSSHSLELLHSLTGLRTIQINIVSTWNHLESAENSAYTEEIIESLASNLRARVVEHANVQIHCILGVERDGQRAQGEYN
jgi:protein-tyrosine phosphatase